MVHVRSNDLRQDSGHRFDKWKVMTKKIKKRKQERKEAIKDTAKEKATSVEENNAENTFDFGGIPPRDLKKNLGCG